MLCIIELDNAYLLEVKRDDLKVHVACNELINQLNVSWSINREEWHEHDNLHRRNQTPELCHNKSTKRYHYHEEVTK